MIVEDVTNRTTNSILKQRRAFHQNCMVVTQTPCGLCKIESLQNSSCAAVTANRLPFGMNAIGALCSKS